MAGQGALSITARLNLRIQEFSKGLSKASTGMTGFANTTAKQFGDISTKLSRIGLGLRDIGRIASGILISQIFYRTAQEISNATNALAAFNEQLDYSRVTYTALFGSSDISVRFLEVLKEQSMSTMYSFEDLTQASKKLLAYGINYKNIAYITEGLGNLAAMSGDTAAMDRISYALGQIYAKGTLKAEEMRQLANAYVPIQQILRESFNLTDDQLGRVGDLRLPAEQVINAIVDYANIKFDSVGEAAMLTITGLKNRITDSLKVIGSEITQPLTNAFKSFLAWVNTQLNGMRDAYQKGGAGGLFEYFVPNENTQQLLRQFFAALINSTTSVARLVGSIAPLIKSVIKGFVSMYSIIEPTITLATNVLAAFISVVLDNRVALRLLTTALLSCAAAWVLFKTKAVSALVVTLMSKVIYGIARAVMVLSVVLTKSPILSIIGLIAAGIIGIAASSKNARNAVSSFFDKLQGLTNGLSSDDVLQVKEGIDKTAASSDEFNNKLGESGEAIDELNKKAADAKKGLLSFDEVFKLNDTKDETSDYDMEGLLDGLDVTGDSLLPSIDDFSSYTDRFVDSLFGDLWESLKRIASASAGGALAGGLIGFAIGGLVTRTMAGAMQGAKWGSRIGAVVGAGFAAFWSDAYNDMEEAVSKITTTGGIGLLIGGLTGMVIAAFATTGLTGKARVDAVMHGGKIGMALGGLIGAGLGGFWAIAKGALENSMSGMVAGGAAGALIGGVAGLVIGAFAGAGLPGPLRLKMALTAAAKGAAIGGSIGTVLGHFWSGASDEVQKSIAALAMGGATGALLGGLAGLVLGAFTTRTLSGALAGAQVGATVGTMLGAPLGMFFGSAESLLKEKLGDMFSGVKSAAYGAFFGGLSGMVVGGIIGAFAGGVGALPGAKIGATLGAAAGAGIGWLVDYLSSIDWGALFNSFGTAVNNSLRAIGGWFVDVGHDIGNWCSNTWQAISVWSTDTWQSFSTWCSNVGNSISTWASSTWSSFGGWAANTGKSIKDWTVNAGNNIKDWTVTAFNNVRDWTVDTGSKISAWATDTGSKISSWWSTTKTGFASWYTDTSSKVSKWCSDTGTNIKNWATNTGSNIKTWWGNMWNIDNWKSGWSSVKEWFSDLFSDIGGWFTDLGANIADWWGNAWDSISGNAKGAIKNVAVNYSFIPGAGHATGGVFNREHVARFAEGNKAEAIIPLQNDTAMQPFVDAVANGLLSSLMPVMATAGGSYNDLPPMYVGTLIADDKGLKELERKLKVIRVKEEKRGN